MQLILLTGASGGVAGELRPMLAKPGRRVRLLDPRPPQNVAAHEEVAANLEEAMVGVDAVIHLGGVSKEAPFSDVVESNDTKGRPDTLYGWSKVAMEACGRLYADRYGMDVICLRIGTWEPAASKTRARMMWLSTADGHRLVEAALSADKPGFRIVWGISRNTRRYCSLAEGEAHRLLPAGRCGRVRQRDDR